MTTNRISGLLKEPTPTLSPPCLVPSGFALVPSAMQQAAPLALQLLAQQQAYEQAILAAREEALRIVLSCLKVSEN